VAPRAAPRPVGGPPVLLIAGPTASGKSALALDLAVQTGGEIVNADSMQIYADLCLLTARPTVSHEAQAPHHLFGVADAAEAWSVGRWLRATTAVLADIGERGGMAIVVGGTGLYLRALTHGLAEVPPVAEDSRRVTEADYERLGEGAFRERLRGVDPRAAERIEVGDRQRLTRAWEVFADTGRSLSDWQADTSPTLTPGSWRALVLEPPREALYARCEARLAAMVEGGALNEVRRLVARSLDPAMKALGVTPFAAHLRGEMTLERALAQTAQDTRRYAKRQTTWFRNQTPDWPRLAESSDSINDGAERETWIDRMASQDDR
jgi:tRNA dimethylallyltransferase